MKRRTALAMGLLPLLPAVARAANSTAGSNGAPLPITIGMQTAPDWELIAARGLNLFDKVGLKPTYLRFTAGAAMMAAAESKSIDVAVPGTVPFTAGLAQGIPWVGIGIDVAAANGQGLVVRNGSGIHTLADLKGKRIGYYRASTAQYGIAVALKKGGVPPDSVRLLSMGPAEQVAAMRAGQIDAAEVWEPWMQKMIHQADARILATEAEYGVDTAAGFFAVRREWLDSHRETARRFLAGIVLAYDVLQHDPEPTIQIVARDTGIDPAWARTIYQEAPPSDPRTWIDPKATYSVVPGGRFQTGSLEPLMQFLVGLHVIQKPVDLSHVLDASVLTEVLHAQPAPTKTE